VKDTDKNCNKEGKTKKDNKNVLDPTLVGGETVTEKTGKACKKAHGLGTNRGAKALPIPCARPITPKQKRAAVQTKVRPGDKEYTLKLWQKNRGNVGSE